MNDELKPWAWLGAAALFIACAISGFTTVETGNVGIETRMGAVTGRVLPEGFSFKMPFLDSVKEMEVRIKKEEVTAGSASKDMQQVTTIAALNYAIVPDRAASLFKEVGMEYVSRIIDPALQESIKAITARYAAEELIAKRESVLVEIKGLLGSKLTPHGIRVTEFNIVDFDFSKSFNEAIEAKVTAEQNAIAAKNKLEQVKYEAEQKIATAKGLAEALRLESEALQENPDVLQLRAIEKWDGTLPLVTGGAMPFIDVGSLKDTAKASARVETNATPAKRRPRVAAID